MHPNYLSRQAVIDRKRKPGRKGPVIPMDNLMKSGVYKEGIDVGEQTV
jgi:hypothetical protein